MYDLDSYARAIRHFPGDPTGSDGIRGRGFLPARLAKLLTPVPVVCFTGALVTDIAYSRSAEMQWANFSAWLLLAGIVFGAIAAVLAVVGIAGGPRGHRNGGWPCIVGSAIVLVLALFNNFVHSRDAWTSVVPTGLTLSALTVIAMIATATAKDATAREIRAGEKR